MENKYKEIANVVEALQQGNDEMFDRLYELTKRMVYFELKSAGVNEVDTEDVLQETYIRIYRKLHTVEDIQASYKWIKQLAYRTGVNHVKSSMVRHEQLSAEDTNDIFESEDSLTNPLPMPEDIMQNKESQRLVREILQGLPVLQYKMILAYYYNESSVKEIAEVFDVPEGTVKTNLYRARAEIKNKVEELEKKQGIKLYTVAALPLFSFFMDAEVQAVSLPDFMQQGMILGGNGVTTNVVTGENSVADAGTVATTDAAAKTGGLSIGVKVLIAAIASALVIGGVAAVTNVIKIQEEAKSESVLEVEETEKEQDVVAQEQTSLPEEVLKVSGVAETEAAPKKTVRTFVYEGEIRICGNNFDGTYEAAFAPEAVIESEIIERANIGDVVTTQMGDQYVLIHKADLVNGYYDSSEDAEKLNLNYPNESDYAVYEVGGDGWGYYLDYFQENGYKLRDPDSACYCADGLQKASYTVEIADDAEIYMLKGMVEDVRIPVEDFKQLDWSNPSAILGEGLWDVYLPIYGTGRIENNKLVYFKQKFRS